MGAFLGAFLENYFPSNLKDQKEIEFLVLKQKEMTIGQYVAKFEELARYINNLINQPDETWKCKRFEQGLRPKIGNKVVTQEIRYYLTLIRKCQLAEQSHSERKACKSPEARQNWKDTKVKQEKKAPPGPAPLCNSFEKYHYG
jgi:hypothetical protein